MKRMLLPVLALCSIALGVLTKRTRRHRRSAPNDEPSRIEPVQAGSLMNVMLAGVIPLWILAGAGDYLWHRRTRIETTSGVRESVSHLLMMLEAGPLVLAALFLEMNAGAIAIMLVSLIAHEATVTWDFRFAAGRRVTPPGEQQVHSCLEILPGTIFWSACCLYWPQALSLIGRGTESPEFALRVREPKLSAPKITAIFVCLTFGVFVPHLEELWRCWRAAQHGLEGHDTPECLPEVYGKRAA